MLDNITIYRHRSLAGHMHKIIPVGNDPCGANSIYIQGSIYKKKMLTWST